MLSLCALIEWLLGIDAAVAMPRRNKSALRPPMSILLRRRVEFEQAMRTSASSRKADLTTATSACALMGMPRVLLPYLLIYQAAPSGRQSWPASDRVPVAVPFRELPNESEGLRCVLHWVAHRSMMLVARRSARTPCAAQMVLSHSCRHATL